MGINRRCGAGERSRGGRAGEGKAGCAADPVTGVGSRPLHAVPKFPCLNSSGFPGCTPDLEVLESPFNYEVSCGRGLLGQRVYTTHEATCPGNKRAKYIYIERTKLRVLFLWCPTWSEQIQGAASFGPAEGAGGEDGTFHPFPRLSSLPRQSRAMAQLTRTILEYFLSLLLYCSRTSVVFVQFPYCSLGFALFSCSCFH